MPKGLFEISPAYLAQMVNALSDSERRAFDAVFTPVEVEEPIQVEVDPMDAVIKANEMELARTINNNIQRIFYGTGN